MKKKKKDPFNPAFEALKDKIKHVRELPEPPLKQELRRKEPDDEIGFFLNAMSGVDPIQQVKEKAVRSSAARAKPAHPPPDERRRAMEHLQGLVHGSIDLDITFSDEYIEGAVKGLSRKLMKKLKRGELPVRDFIDLHGLTRQQAEGAVADFVHQSYKTGLRCILIVHGRGLNSPDSFPVLKEGLPTWLGRGKTGKLVLAFSTARPYDGGTGATYVLLRKR
ncbi:MAG: Smr/MutS family protein [Deltaproteobacteria bacterium]|nr:Smr/MutS family protein [Deltaproteobacteria bacterium]